MRCLQPPLDVAPEGDWFCPECVPPPENYYPPPHVVYGTASPHIPYHAPSPMPPPPQTPAPPSPSLRHTSVESSHAPPERPKRQKSRAKISRRKSKPALAISEDSEEEVDAMVSPARVQRSSRKGKERARVVVEEEEEPAAPTPARRKRAHVSEKASNASPEKSLPRVRLRLGKKRGAEEDDLPHKGLFDDILTEQDRDVSSTNIYASDKVRFDRSLRNAEVG